MIEKKDVLIKELEESLRELKEENNKLIENTNNEISVLKESLDAK